MQLWIVEHFHLQKKVHVVINYNRDYGHPMKAKIKEIWKFGPMWQTKYASAVPKKFWEREWVLGCAGKMISSPGVRSLWIITYDFFKCYDSLVQVPFCEDESVQLFRVAFFRIDFFQNPYFSITKPPKTPLFVHETDRKKSVVYNFFATLNYYSLYVWLMHIIVTSQNTNDFCFEHYAKHLLLL